MFAITHSRHVGQCVAVTNEMPWFHAAEDQGCQPDGGTSEEVSGGEQVVRWTTWELLGNLTAVEDGPRLALLDLLARRGGGSRPNLEEVLADEPADE